MKVNDMPKNCNRCGDELRASIMSKFNRDVLCMPCKEDERLAPGYKATDEAELQAVRSGNYNFEGTGLSGADRVFLAERRQARKATGCACERGHSLSGSEHLPTCLKRTVTK